MKKLLSGILALLAVTSAAQTTIVGGGGGFASGSTASGCTAYSLVYVDSSGNLACALAPVNGSVSTAGRGIFSVLDVITGASATSNFLNVTGTFPATLSAATSGSYFSTVLDNDAQNQSGVYSVISGSAGSAFNAAMRGDVTANGTSAIGVYGNANTSIGTAIGVWGNRGVLATNSFGGYFSIGAGAYPTGLAALGASNGTAAENIAEFRDNGAATSTTAASANVTILDGAQMRLGNQVLTSATMTPTIVGEARTVTHSYAWTNAMVAALGASTTGDITVATLPAKTQVNNAYVVIDGAAAGPATVTVSCGDAIAGTPFINYIVAVDAKAAANTVYGDAVAERGTAIDVEFYYLPAYAATTLVTCHFISTGANLSTVTGSAGRLVLTTTLLP